MSSGTRLKAIKHVATDGFSTTNFMIHDTMRNEDCYFTLAADDKTRCLPLVGYATIVAFSDSGCAQPVAFIVSCTAAPRYVVRTETSAVCGQIRWRIYQLGSKLAPATQVFTGTPGSCNPTAQNAGYDYYQLGAEVPATSFVEATAVVQP